MPKEERKQLAAYTSIGKMIKPDDIRKTVEKAQKDCEKKQWKLYTNRNGEEVLLRDKLSKVAQWLVEFEKVGDAVVQFDPSHATLPWMAVKAVLQVSRN